jgi:hypothetical protein
MLNRENCQAELLAFKKFGVVEQNCVVASYKLALAPCVCRRRSPQNLFYGDGAYDPWEGCDELERRGIEQVVPPREDAVLQNRRDGTRNERD